MNIHVFLVNWDSVYNSVLRTEQQLLDIGVKYTVLDSGSEIKDRLNWEYIGDVRFYGQLYEALKRTNDEDYIIFMLGDATTEALRDIVDTIVATSKHVNVGIYAPYYTQSPWNMHQTSLEQLKTDKALVTATQTDGILTAFSKDVYSKLRIYMDYLNNEVGIINLRTGWGMDYIWCAICVELGKFIIRDTDIIVKHPHGSSYDHGKASEEMHIVMGKYLQWSQNAEYSEGVFSNIRRRMASDPEITERYFYGDAILYLEDIEPPYHIINVNNARQHKVDDIERKVLSARLTIPSVNAYDESSIGDFQKRNPEFYLAGPWFKQGEIGCFASHYEFWKYVRDNKIESAIVFEDDATVHDNFNTRVSHLLKLLPETYDVFSIFVSSDQAPRYNNEQAFIRQIAKGYQDWSTLCYAVPLKGATRLCELLQEYGVTEPVDHYIFRKGHAGLLSVYTLPPRETRLVDIDENCIPSIVSFI